MKDALWSVINDNRDNNSEISCYPNPASNTVHFVIAEISDTPANLQIMNSKGQLVLEKPAS